MTLLEKIWTTKNYRIAFCLAAVMLIWLASGLLSGQSDSETQVSEEEGDLTLVKAKVISAEDYALSISVRARTEPNRAVDVRSEVSGTVVGLPVERGELVEAGDVICELSEEDRPELVEQAKTALNKAELDYEGAQRLETGGFQSRSEIAAAEAALGNAQAFYKRAQLNLQNTKVRAPFSGVVDSRPVEIGDLMQVGEVCAQVLDMDPLLITGQVSEADIAFVELGRVVNANLLTGESVNGKLRYIQRSADPVTRTFRIEAVVENPDLSLLSGISARLDIESQVVPAHLVNSSLLLLDDEGALGLRILDDKNIVQRVGVQLVGDHESGVWVTGLPETTTLITIGQLYVGEGEQVLADIEPSEARVESDAEADSSDTETP